MELTEKQKLGLETALYRYQNKLKYTVISGYAGTGKTTLVRHIIEAINPNPNDVVYCAYTGKACKVLQQKGNQNVSTLHKLLYKFQPLPNGKYIKTLRKVLDYSIIVVDECSMMSQTMVDELLSYNNIYVIFLGDPFQIPPVKGEENGLLQSPHVFLDEIMRQALDNEIIKFSMDVRLGNPLPTSYKGKTVQIVPKAELNTNMLKWADQILCATNATRASINNQMRELSGLEGDPKPGDKIICLKNNWDEYDNDGNALVNGTIGIINSIYKSYFPMYKYFKLPGNVLPYYDIDFATEEDTEFHVKADINLFTSDAPYLTDSQRFQIMRNKQCHLKGVTVPDQFAFAYAITVHKAQGSQWNKVLILEERFPFSDLEHRRWLYTAITRAVDKIVLVR